MKATIAIATAALMMAAAADAAAKPRHHRPDAQPRAYSSDPHIACTEWGCGPVPFGCGKRPGIPGSRTAARYDEVVCPPAGGGRGFRMR